MKSRYLKIRTAVLICDIVCILLSLIFFHQIKANQNADIEAKMTAMIADLTEENDDLQESMSEVNDVLQDKENQIIFDMQKLLLKSDETEEKIKEAEDWYESLEICYQIKMYIDSIAAQMDAADGSSDYIDRYFRIEKDELEAIVGNYAIEKENGTFPIVTEKSDALLPIGEKIWLKYGAGDEGGLPLGLLVQNPMIDIGYQNARAGMTLYEIGGELPAEKEKYDLDSTSCFYLHYEDKRYQYYYISIDGSENPTILYIEPKQ